MRTESEGKKEEREGRRKREKGRKPKHHVLLLDSAGLHLLLLPLNHTLLGRLRESIKLAQVRLEELQTGSDIVITVEVDA